MKSGLWRHFSEGKGSVFMGRRERKGLVSWEVEKEGVECLRGKKVVKGKGF